LLITEQKPVLFIHEYLNKIDTSSHFLLGLINDISVCISDEFWCRMHQCGSIAFLSDLLSNAAKFTPMGGTIEFVSERIEPNRQDDEENRFDKIPIL
jgi:signal transduction histidine kinase